MSTTFKLPDRTRRAGAPSKYSLIFKSNSLITEINSLFVRLGKWQISIGNLGIFGVFRRSGGRILRIFPVSSLFIREIIRDGFAPDCTHRHSFSCEPPVRMRPQNFSRHFNGLADISARYTSRREKKSPASGANFAGFGSVRPNRLETGKSGL